MNQQLWKDVPGYEGLYRININGKIISLHQHYYNDEIKQHLSKKGYWTVRLSKDGRQCHLLVHRLLAKAFIDNPEEKPFVNHINGNKQDYSLSNLEWVTAQENMIHAYKLGLCYNFRTNKRIVFDKSNGKLYDSITNAANANRIPYSTLVGYLTGLRPNRTCLEFAN